MQTLRGLLLDLDGTFLDSNDAHAMSWVDAFAEANLELDVEKVRRRIGMGGDKLMEDLVGMKDDSPEGEKISARRAVIFKDRYLEQLRPFRGGRELLERALSEGLKLVMATSATGPELESLLRAAQIEDLIKEAATSSDAKNSKPDPDIILAAIAKSGFRPGELLMLGDTPYDVIAAKKAGVGTIAVRSGGWNDEELAGAIAIYDHVHALYKGYDESLLAHRA